MSSSPPTTTVSTYWCHECDMSILLSAQTGPTPPRCPHCQNSFLDHMDSFPPLEPTYNTTQPTHSTRASRSIIQSLKGVTIGLEVLEFCSICKDQFGGGGERGVVNELPCGHVFHNGCIVPWLEISSTCPLCRFRFEEVEGEEEIYIGGMSLDEFLDDEEGGYEDEFRRLMRIEREGGRMMFSPTQIGEAGEGGGEEVERGDSVETVSSWPVWQTEGEREVGNSDVENVVRA